MKRRTRNSSPDLPKAGAALWRRLGAALTGDIFDRFDSFGDALGAALDGFSPDELRALLDLIDGPLAGDAQAAWQASGAEIGFGGARDARMALMMLAEAAKARL